MSIGELLGKYYTFIFVMVILLYTILINRRMYSKVKGKFMTIIVLVVLETVLAAIEDWFKAQPYRSIWRSVLSTACYIIRPTIMYVLLNPG